MDQNIFIIKTKNFVGVHDAEIKKYKDQQICYRTQLNDDGAKIYLSLNTVVCFQDKNGLLNYFINISMDRTAQEQLDDDIELKNLTYNRIKVSGNVGEIIDQKMYQEDPYYRNRIEIPQFENSNPTDSKNCGILGKITFCDWLDQFDKIYISKLPEDWFVQQKDIEVKFANIPSLFLKWDKKYNPCKENSCASGGICVPISRTKYKCDLCKDKTCPENSSCVDGRCECNSGYIGDKCERDNCFEITCPRNSICVDGRCVENIKNNTFLYIGAAILGFLLIIFFWYYSNIQKKNRKR